VLNASRPETEANFLSLASNLRETETRPPMSTLKQSQLMFRLFTDADQERWEPMRFVSSLFRATRRSRSYIIVHSLLSPLIFLSLYIFLSCFSQIAIFSILLLRSPAHLNAISTLYLQQHHHPLTRLVTGEFSGHVKNALLYVVEAAEKGPEARDAHLLEAAMKGMGSESSVFVFALFSISNAISATDSPLLLLPYGLFFFSVRETYQPKTND